MISPIFTTVVLVGAFIWIYMKITTSKLDNANEEFIEREIRANATRRKSLDNLEYIKFTMDDFDYINPSPGSRLEELYDTLFSLSATNIVNLTGITNTDLKFSYGAANLPTLTEYDQNYTKLARCVYDLGVELENEGRLDDAIKAYSFGIKINTDISANYIKLANLYVSKNNFSEINNLIAAAENIRSLTRNTTVSKLEEILDSHTTMVIPRNSSESDSSDDPGNILPADILDILETVPYKSDDQT